jgi:hypothetical protein
MGATGELTSPGAGLLRPAAMRLPIGRNDLARQRFPYRPEEPIDRQTARAIRTFGKRVTTGMAVVSATAGDGTREKKETAVKAVAKQIGRRDRYVWGTVTLGAELHAKLLAIVEAEAVEKRRRSPRAVASAFLLRQLSSGAQLAEDIMASARKAGIADHTLRRAGKSLGVEKRRVGGRNGHWSWELSAATKKYFGLDD